MTADDRRGTGVPVLHADVPGGRSRRIAVDAPLLIGEHLSGPLQQVSETAREVSQTAPALRSRGSVGRERDREPDLDRSDVPPSRVSR